MSQRPSFLVDAFKAIRPGFATAIMFSFFINLLAFVGPLYMLQVYDRVLGSRNLGTLVALTIIAGFLLIDRQIHTNSEYRNFWFVPG